MKSIRIVLPVLILTLFLYGCGSNPATDTKVETTVPSPTIQTVATTESVIMETEETVAVIETTEPEVKDYSIPEDFIDYYKFIGENISVLNVDTSSWDYYNFTQPLWRGSFLGHSGEISVQLGWDNETIYSLFFLLDESSYLTEDEFSELQLIIQEKFGDVVEESGIAFSYSGKSDYEFQLPKPDKTQCCILSWNMEKSLEYMHSKPKENRVEETTKPTKPEYDPEIGMTREEVEGSRWGKPDDINKTTTKYGVTEQWVYETYDHDFKFIYFEDGIVTVIQE